MLIFKTLKSMLKTFLMRLPLHVSVYMYGHRQWAREQHFVQLLNWIPLMYIRCVFVQYAAVCHYCLIVYVSGDPV
jgi:undecaprenyl pyrophosphate synthase